MRIRDWSSDVCLPDPPPFQPPRLPRPGRRGGRRAQTRPQCRTGRPRTQVDHSTRGLRHIRARIDRRRMASPDDEGPRMTPIHAIRNHACAAALALATFAGLAPAAPLRQSFAMQVTAPPVPVSIDGARRVVYELHLTNFAGEALTPLRVEVRDASDGTGHAASDGHAPAHSLPVTGSPYSDGAHTPT